MGGMSFIHSSFISLCFQKYKVTSKKHRISADSIDELSLLWALGVSKEFVIVPRGQLSSVSWIWATSSVPLKQLQTEQAIGKAKNLTIVKIVHKDPVAPKTKQKEHTAEGTSFKKTCSTFQTNMYMSSLFTLKIMECSQEWSYCLRIPQNAWDRFQGEWCQTDQYDLIYWATVAACYYCYCVFCGHLGCQWCILWISSGSVYKVEDEFKHTVWKAARLE